MYITSDYNHLSYEKVKETYEFECGSDDKWF